MMIARKKNIKHSYNLKQHRHNTPPPPKPRNQDKPVGGNNALLWLPQYVTYTYHKRQTKIRRNIQRTRKTWILRVKLSISTCQISRLNWFKQTWMVSRNEKLWMSMGCWHRINLCHSVNWMLTVRSGKVTKCQSYAIQSPFRYISITFQLTEWHSFILCGLS